MLYAIAGVLVLLVDQLTKYLTVAKVALNTYDGPNLLGLVGITYIRNYGAAFGLLENKRWLLFIVLVLFLAAMAFLLWKGFIRTPFSRLTGTLLTAGALGNGIDRLIYGYVVDMVELLPGKVRLPIFNLADCLITICGILFCVSLILGLRDRAEDYEDEYAAPARKPRRADPFSEPDEGAHDPFAAGRVPRRKHRDEEEELAGLEDLVPASARRPARRAEAAEAAPVRPRRPVQNTEEAPVRPRRPVQNTEETPARPVRKAPVTAAAAPARKPAAPAARPAPAADDFDLDSILAEFK